MAWSLLLRWHPSDHLFIAIFMPAKGLAVWATPELFSRLPERAMRSFWPRFDDFYFGFDPVLRVQVIDGVISFPSFHAIVGFLTSQCGGRGLDPHTRQRVSRDPAPLDPARRGTTISSTSLAASAFGPRGYLLPTSGCRWASGIREDLRRSGKSRRSKRARACPTYPHSCCIAAFAAQQWLASGAKHRHICLSRHANSEVRCSTMLMRCSAPFSQVRAS